jgi:hypothetical protein
LIKFKTYQESQTTTETELKEKLLEGKFHLLTSSSRYGVFHNTIEEYINRQWRAYTVPRVAVFWGLSWALMQHGLFSIFNS